jgi:hypothetical protein
LPVNPPKAWAEIRRTHRLSEEIRRHLPAAKASRISHELVTNPRCRVDRNAPEHFVAGGVIEMRSYLVGARNYQTEKQETEDTIMRLLLLTAAASFVLTGAVMSAPAEAKTKHHHYRESNASAPAAAPADPGAAPADTMSAHDSHMMNLRESGYNPKDDLTSAGNVKAN